MKHTRPVIPAKAKPRAGIQSIKGWMPDQVRHDIPINLSVLGACGGLSLICEDPCVEQSEIPIHRDGHLF
jgi:hypothetical protein